MDYKVKILSNKVNGLTGYAFIDKYNHCFIIVYGIKNKLELIKKLKL